MSKIFNVTGRCNPDLHYMVELGERLQQIKEMVDRGDYFTINRARQYGKTTTLKALAKVLAADYTILSLDFQKEMSDAKFQNENTFSIAFANAFLWKIQNGISIMTEAANHIIADLRKTVRETPEQLELVELFRYFSMVCQASSKPIVLLIDEVDSATNNQVFLDFLAQLRGYYLDRDETPTFQSVILAGVYDVKNIKRKLRSDDVHKVNSPWNIAVDFLIDMSFSAPEIAGMLREYESDYRTGMDIAAMSDLIYNYTSGYPFLVSRICKLIDERVANGGGASAKKAAWTKQGFLEAVNMLLSEKNTLFESLAQKVIDYPELQQILQTILFQGQRILYSPDSPGIDLAIMFGFIKVSGNTIVIANRIFETRLYNLFLTEPNVQNSDTYRYALLNQNHFIQNGRLNMERVLEKFVLYFDDLYGDQQQAFYEEDGRRYFLLFLRPIINGSGNYYIEARTRNMERTDVIVDYQGEQFVVELKLWRGDAYNSRGEKQLMDYLDYYHLDTGYMLSFNFNKKKKIGLHKITLGDKLLIEAVV